MSYATRFTTLSFTLSLMLTSGCGSPDADEADSSVGSQDTGSGTTGNGTTGAESGASSGATGSGTPMVGPGTRAEVMAMAIQKPTRRRRARPRARAEMEMGMLVVRPAIFGTRGRAAPGGSAQLCRARVHQSGMTIAAAKFREATQWAIRVWPRAVIPCRVTTAVSMGPCA